MSARPRSEPPGMQPSGILGGGTTLAAWVIGHSGSQRPAPGQSGSTLYPSLDPAPALATLSSVIPGSPAC